MPIYKLGFCLLALCAALLQLGKPALAAHKIPKPESIDAKVAALMHTTGAKGLSLAIIEKGKVILVKSYGNRNANGDPLTTDTVMYGASLTKTVIAYTVMSEVDNGTLSLDTPIDHYLSQPLTSYGSEDTINRYADFTKLDERWRKLTPRILLTHSAGFSNFGFLEPDGKLKFHFDPGSRYAYSGDGLITLQFVMENGLKIDIGSRTRAIFDRLGMTNTSLIWRPDFANNLADGWTASGAVEPHDERSKVRASGSMDTTIADFAKFAAALVKGEGLSKQSASEIFKPQLHITTKTQFPSLQPPLATSSQRPDLYAGLGLIVFKGPEGPGFFKGGHNDSTANTLVCIQKSQRCVIILSNDVRSETEFPALVKFILGDTGVPYEWEYGVK